MLSASGNTVLIETGHSRSYGHRQEISVFYSRVDMILVLLNNGGTNRKGGGWGSVGHLAALCEVADRANELQVRVISQLREESGSSPLPACETPGCGRLLRTSTPAVTRCAPCRSAMAEACSVTPRITAVSVMRNDRAGWQVTISAPDLPFDGWNLVTGNGADAEGEARRIADMVNYANDGSFPHYSQNLYEGNHE